MFDSSKFSSSKLFNFVALSSRLLLRLRTTMKSTIFYSNGMHFIKQSRNAAILSGITLLPLPHTHTNTFTIVHPHNRTPTQSTTITMGFYPVLRHLLGWLYAIIAVRSSSTPDPILKAQAKGPLGAFQRENNANCSWSHC